MFVRKASMKFAFAAAALACTPAYCALTFNNTFTFANFGANAAAAQAAVVAVENLYSSDFTDNIHINITFNAMAGTSVFGESSSALSSTTYANFRTKAVADETSADDATALGGGGSWTATDPTSGAGTFWATHAEAKALGVIPDSTGAGDDGTITFGAGNPFTFSGPIAGGTFDFQGVVAHEIAEVMGRIGLGGTTSGFPNGFTILDLFSFTGAGTRQMGSGGSGTQGSFSINDGTTLLKLYNNAAGNGLDLRDWCGTAVATSCGSPNTSDDSFNQFADSGVVNPVSAVDLRELDVIGYNLAAATTPEPSTGILLISAFAAGSFLYCRRRNRAPLR
jgi:hypothetical protein